MMTEFKYSRHTGRETRGFLDEISSLYAQAYAEPPYNSDPLFAQDEFLARTGRQVTSEGFTLILARTLEGGLTGFSFGLPFGKRWWAGIGTPQPVKMLGATKFAVIELVVDRSFRGMGIGKFMLSELLAGRSEDFAILTSVPDAPAHEMYLSWGWEKVGTVIAKQGAPLMDAMALPLTRD